MMPMRYSPSFFYHTTFANPSGFGFGGFSQQPHSDSPVTVISQPSSVVFDEAVIPAGAHGTTASRSFRIGGL